MPERVYRIIEQLFYVLLIVVCGIGALAAWRFASQPGLPDRAPADPPLPAWDETGGITGRDLWDTLYRSPAQQQAPKGGLSRQYRLAGTFFSFDPVDDRRQMTARAIVDDLQNERQYLIAEQDTLGRAQVYRILRDRIILRLDGREEVLWLSFSGGKDRGPGPSRSQQTTATGPAAAEPLEVTRYGKRVGERRWVMQRESLMDYYEELLDEPERLANIYISLKPDYNENQRIDGYELDMAGEEDFFKAVGLRQGDHIRKVNSMRMTSQSRAEYFLSEFAKNRVSALVLDIERANEPMKLIYLIR